MSFLCSFSWTSFNLLDSSMRLAHSQFELSISLSHSISNSISLSLWCAILAFLCSMHFILLPSSLPASSFPFALRPALAADPPLLYITVLPFQYAVPALVHIISSRVVCHLSVPRFNAYRSFLAPFQLPLSLPFYLVRSSCPLACVDILQVLARGSRTSLVSPFLSV